ncbi:hypothetical protein GCM10022216_14500 [Sphingobacterium kyonggiense]|uniref:Uncharacterized protein n=1 Tax=Sphingobacterium kyonggiense TaxID=714075 RepID=A0ABP7YLM8_9SPHI
MKLVHNNNCIECFSAEIISRKIVPGTFLNLKNIGKVFTYKCSRNSEATIKKELLPKKPLYNNNSFLDLETKLECDRLFVIVRAKKPYDKDLKNHTHRHKAQSFLTDDFTFAQITYQLKNIPLLATGIKLDIK